MPYVNIKLADDGISAEQKRTLIRGVHDLLGSVLGRDDLVTHVVIDAVPLDDWGFKGEQLSERRRRTGGTASR